MSFSTCWYCLKTGTENICRNIWFSLASVATISACIFLFCLFFSIVANIRFMVHHVESTVGITVLFDESLTEEQILALGDEIGKRPEIREMKYVSARRPGTALRRSILPDMRSWRRALRRIIRWQVLHPM